MRILGIDYGRKKIGLAVSSGLLAEPLKVIRVQSINDAITKLAKIIKTEKIEKVVVGVSEGQMGEETKKFASALSLHLSALPAQAGQAGLLYKVATFNETLTTQDAQRLAQEAGVKRMKRKAMEDAYAASIMLQNYLDSKS